MNHLHINVVNKVASYQKRDGAIVCGNSDYQILFTFDSEWEAYAEKTARFIVNGTFTDVDFNGNTCPVPIIRNASQIEVGVYAGNLTTTTSAVIPALLSVLCGGEPPTPENDKNYANEAKEAADRAEVAADRAEEAASSIAGGDHSFATEIYVKEYAQPKGNYLTSESDPTVPAWAKATNKPTYNAAEINYSGPELEEIDSGTTIESAILGINDYLVSLPEWSKQKNKPTYTKSEVGLGNVDNVKQYSASNPPPYPVSSVNGKSGAVSLSASDVGALASASHATKDLVVTYDDGSSETVRLVVAK